ncbi:hypothetical protein QIS74_02517 [Colletotrichum tabaci]|uniref:Uncharacterized protein n=1 Tax=Colletotrichum tabaci TaxID=1209068 RepID=A0AAV9TNU5_9PEZI
MRYYTLLALWAFSSATAAPLDGAALASQNIQVTLHFLKAEHMQPSMTAYNNDRSKVIGRSCSTSLALGTSSIVFAVDRNGSGNITVNEREFRVIDDPELSGGIVCGRMHSDLETVVNCEVAVPASLDLAHLDRRSAPGCMWKRSAGIEDGLGLEATLEGFYRRPGFLPLEQPLAPPDNLTLTERQNCGVTKRDSYRVGDGNPHQNPLNIQLSAKILRNFQKPKSFLFHRLVRFSNSLGCDGNPGDYFALWKKQAQTAYTVQNRMFVCDEPRDAGGNYVMWSPNRDNRGGWYYCVHGRQYVRWMGDRWLDTTPVRGGPP